jgi:hypothetical protein
MATWKQTAGRKIGRLDQQSALDTLAKIRAESRGQPTIFSATIRELTGGFNSQSINFTVIRKLGVKAGIIKNAR